MKASLFLIAFAAVALKITKQDSCHLREIDLCVATSVVSLRESPIPQNEEQMNEQCNVGRETIECLNNFTNKCATKLQREIITFASEGGRESFNRYCTPGSDLRKTILERSECLTEAWEEQKSCMTDAQAGVESISDSPADKRLDVLCCTYRRYRKCGTEIARKKCGEDVDNFIDEMTSLVVANLPNLICNGCDDDYADCESLLPPLGTQPKGSDSDSPHRPTPRFIFKLNTGLNH